MAATATNKRKETTRAARTRMPSKTSTRTATKTSARAKRKTPGTRAR